MSENSKIEWCDHTFNPWEGCQKVGPGCDHCYAETRNARFGGGKAPNWGPGAPRRRTSAANWRKPVAWNAAHDAFFREHGRRQRVFCASLADVFDNAVDPSWRADLFALIERTPNLDWLLLTKRIGNVNSMMVETGARLFWLDHLDKCRFPDNVWLGATIVNQEEADRDIPKLLDVPACIRFISMEPLLGPVDLSAYLRVCCNSPVEGNPGWHLQPPDPPTCCCDFESAIDWVIVGGESGTGARPMHIDWARSLRDQCACEGVPFLFKQHGEYQLGSDFKFDDGKTISVDRRGRFTAGTRCEDYPAGASSADGWVMVRRVGKKAAGRYLDGVTHDGFPRDSA
jgi:protein gp37